MSDFWPPTANARDDGESGQSFPVVRRGYDRAAVDQFTRAAHAEITELRSHYETLAAHYQEQQEQLAARSSTATDGAEPGGRASEILRMAEERARDRAARADADAVRLREQAEHEVRAGLESARQRASAVVAEADQAALVMRQETARLRSEALDEVEQIRRAAQAEGEELLARARQQAATLEERSRQEFAWRRRQLRQEQDRLTQREQDLLAQREQTDRSP